MKYLNICFSIIIAVAMLLTSLTACGSGECEHIYANDSEWTITKQPTCSEDGSCYNECLRCGESITLPVQKLGHSITSPERHDPTCTEEGWLESECTNCKMIIKSDKTPALGHSFENGVCTVCGSEENTQ